ncbi:MAG: hypothetical protein Kow0042_10170 [Calditrichia bacterium]
MRLLPDSVQVTVSSENVRAQPNGVRIGKLHNGDVIHIRKRVGNWLLFYNEKYDSAYIWAPSTGFAYINLYNPHTYFDTTRGQFYPLNYFRQLFGSEGEIIQDYPSEYVLFFEGLGLGSHEETVIEVVSSRTQEVKHGIQLFISKENGGIKAVKVDFLRPVKGLKAASKKCGIPGTHPGVENARHVHWERDTLIKGLAVELERKEWESAWFSGISFKTIED